MFIGEVGLTGEVRAVSQIDKRIIEAKRLGFSTVVVPLSSLRVLQKEEEDVEVKGISNVKELLNIIL